MRRAAALAVVAALAGCGGGDDPKGPLAWKDDPQVFISKARTSDRVVLGTVRNVGLRDELTLDASRLRVKDAEGRDVEAYGQYIGSYAHGLYGAYQKPSRLPDDEARRLGLKIKLKPGTTAPLYVAFRTRPGLKAPFHVEYGSGSLPVPEKARRE